MKPIVKRIAFIFLTLFMVFAFGQSAMSLVGSEPGTNGSGGIVVNPNAAGTKYEGPLTIYYVPVDSELEPGNVGKYYLHMFLRLRKGSTLWGFSGISAEPVNKTATTDAQAQVIRFMNETVMPILYSNYTPPDDPTDPSPSNMQTSNYPWYLKSVDQVVSDNPVLFPNCCKGMTFVIMDVVAAVQD